MELRRGVWRAGALIAVIAVALVAPQVGFGNTRPLVFATARPGQSLNALLQGRFFELVTCTRACESTTTISISARLARALGFKGVRPRVNYIIGSKTVRLRANKTTKVTVSLTARARTRMTHVQKRFQLTGHIIASPRTGSKQKEAALWFVGVKV
jgi:hypothetical protein